MASNVRLPVAFAVVVAAVAAALFATRGGGLVAPPGSALPSGAQCTWRVDGDGWEPRAENIRANRTSGHRIARINGANAEGNSRLVPRIDGNFTGTTDEIIQWAACKWGLHPDLLRAQAHVESNWNQSAVGDGGQSFGLLQIKSTSHPGTFPASRDSTAFNVDYSAGFWRLCYEGMLWWPDSRGDLWGCIGAHFSGTWRRDRANVYIEAVDRARQQKPWERWDG